MENEKRLISAKELERQIKEAFKDNPYAMGQMLRWIRKQPTVDAVEVVHGKWDISEDAYMGEYVYQCSVCKSELVTLDGTQADELWKYCPNCGAKMDGGDNDAARR